MWFLRKCSSIQQTRRLSTLAPTIFALSSGQGKCGVAVIRVSGPKASDAILKMTKCPELPKPRVAGLHHIRDPITMEELDKGLILWFPGPRSFTGEDSCEFQIHGGLAVVNAVLTALSKLPGYKPAEPGEFTKRAFFNGKLDLTEVEGLGDLIHAETELQRKQALYQMEGNLGKRYKKWRAVLIKNLAHVEAYIDFSEDDHIEDNVLQDVNKKLSNLQKEIKNHLSDGRRGERLRDGIRTTIIGEPNAGKSSLLNALCQRPAAIVTPIPGTTRDIIETHINVNGFPVILTDTAGLRTETLDVVEQEGIKRAHASIEKADLLFLIIDVTKFDTSSTRIEFFLENHLKLLNLNISVKEIFDKKSSPKYICILNKIDLLNEEQRIALANVTKNHCLQCISCKTEDGFSSLMKDLKEVLKDLCGNPSRENPSLTQSRHRYHLNECQKYLEEYFALIQNNDVALAAQKLRLSVRHLGKIVGEVGTEEILDVIFKEFCIGK